MKLAVVYTTVFISPLALNIFADRIFNDCFLVLSPLQVDSDPALSAGEKESSDILVKTAKEAPELTFCDVTQVLKQHGADEYGADDDADMFCVKTECQGEERDEGEDALLHVRSEARGRLDRRF